MEETALSSQEPVHIDLLKTPPNLTVFEVLPPEILTMITTHLPSVFDILSLGATSRQLRCTILGISPNRDAIARTWILANAPWYIPTDEALKLAKSPKGTRRETFLKWSYLHRCIRSGSMRNRGRIWQVVQRMEIKADEMGL